MFSDKLYESSNEIEIIAVLELLKQNICITNYHEFYEQLINTVFFNDKLLHFKVGVINIYLELASEFFKSCNKNFLNVIVGKKKNYSNDSLLHDWLENICFEFLFEKPHGTVKNDVQISIQSNVLNLLIVCCDISPELFIRNNYLVEFTLHLIHHTDFLMREKTFIFISQLIERDILPDELKRKCYTLLALVRI